MKTISIADLRAQTEGAKRRIGWVDNEASTQALRNKGGTRTDAKRALLARIDERAREAGVEPLPAFY